MPFVTGSSSFSRCRSKQVHVRIRDLKFFVVALTTHMHQSTADVPKGI